VAGSRAKIRALFGVTPRFFCYPFGHLDTRVVAAVRAAGYRAATTTRGAFATPADPYRLARVQVSRGVTGIGLLRRLRGLRPR
jgi:peptidoglycan/xylan/chitin deacetylase (PgdA/CDA1 family)